MKQWPWQITFEVDFDTNPGDTPTSWADLSTRVRPGLTVTRGQMGGHAEGTSVIALNNTDRELDPTYTSASYNLIPMRHARVTVTVNETSYPLFRGFVKGWAPVWPEAKQGIVDVELVDAFAWIGLQDQDVDLDRQRTGTRIDALLDAAGWPAGLRDIDDGQVWLGAYEQPEANLLRAMVDAADAEDGELYVDAEGVVTFRDRHHRLGATVQDTFGPDELKVFSVVPVYDTDAVTNIARIQLADGSTYTWDDDDSIDANGPRSEPFRDLSFPPYEAVAYAQWTVHNLKDVHLWLDSLTSSGKDPAKLARLLGLEVGDRVDFVHTPPGPGTAEMSGHLETVSHTIGDGSWLSTFSVSPYFGGGDWMTWNDGSDTQGGPGWDDEGALWAP